MRILIVNYRYFISGGPEKYMFNVKHLLEEHGHEVIPFSIHSNKNIETEYSKYFVEPIGDRDVTYYDEYKKTPKTIIQMLSRSIYSFEVKRALQREIDDIRPDLVYIIHFVNKLSPSVIRGAKQKGIPVVLRLSDFFLLCPRFDFLRDREVCEDCITKGYGECIKNRCVRGSLAASIVRVMSMKLHNWLRIYDDVDAFITPTNFLRNKLIESGFDSKKIHYIPTFTTEKSENDDVVIGEYGLYFGRITKEKGVETIIKVYEQLPEYNVKIAGDDTTDEANRLKKYVVEKNLKNIEFLGFKKGDELEEIIKNARFTIISSIWYENMPNTALESFSYDKPIIASNIGSIPEIIKDGENGYLFEPGDICGLKEKVILMQKNTTIYFKSDNLRTSVKNVFSKETHYKALISLFNTIV